MVFKRPNIYLCARVSEDAHKINNEIAGLLSPHFNVFVPHQKEAELKQPKDPVEIYNLDIDAMKNADLCFTIAPFGKDCSWEMGHFIGEKKPIFMYVPDMESLPIGEWMISGGITVIISDNVKVIEEAQHHFNWSTIYAPLKHLGSVVHKYYQNGGR